MKSKWMIAGAVLFMLAAVSGYAQTTRTMQVTVPFEFTIHNQVLPAGEYLVSELATNSIPVLLIRGGKDQPALLSQGIVTYRDGQPGSASAVFHRYGTSYFLTNIWWGGGSSLGVDVPESKTERELAKTASVRRPDQVVLLASR
jgi:hypothetical protein